MKRITLRLPDDLHDAINAIAEKEDRSLNAQIVNAIKYYIDMNRRRDLADKNFEEMRAGNFVELSPAEILALDAQEGFSDDGT